MGFWSLQHTSESKVHSFAGFACPLRSVFRVWLPSWRLTPCDPQPVLFHTGSAPGIHPSELDLPAGIRTFPPGSTHLPLACRCSHPRQVGVRPARQASVSGLYPCRQFRIAIGGFSTATVGSSLGVYPSRACRKGLDRDFARSPLSRFTCRIANDPTGRRPRVSISLRLDPPCPPVSRRATGEQPL